MGHARTTAKARRCPALRGAAEHPWPPNNPPRPGFFFQVSQSPPSARMAAVSSSLFGLSCHQTPARPPQSPVTRECPRPPHGGPFPPPPLGDHPLTRNPATPHGRRSRALHHRGSIAPIFPLRSCRASNPNPPLKPNLFGERPGERPSPPGVFRGFPLPPPPSWFAHASAGPLPFRAGRAAFSGPPPRTSWFLFPRVGPDCLASPRSPDRRPSFYPVCLARFPVCPVLPGLTSSAPNLFDSGPGPCLFPR